MVRYTPNAAFGLAFRFASMICWATFRISTTPIRVTRLVVLIIRVIRLMDCGISLRTACGRMIHSACSITRRWRVSGVSPGSTSTAFCRMISPPSGISLTKCTVAPVTFTPRASAASCTFSP